MYIMPITNIYNKGTYKSNVNKRNDKCINTNPVTFKAELPITLNSASTTVKSNSQLRQFYKQGIEYNELFVDALKRARLEIEYILEENGFNLEELCKPKKDWFTYRPRTLELLEDPSVQRGPLIIGPSGTPFSAIILKSKKYPDATLKYFESRFAKYPTLLYDNGIVKIDDNVTYNLGPNEQLHIVPLIRRDGYYLSDNLFGRPLIAKKLGGIYSCSDRYSDINDFVYGIFNPKNGAEYNFSLNSGQTEMLGMRNANTGEVADCAKGGWFLIPKDNSIPTKNFDPNCVWTLKDEKLVLDEDRIFKAMRKRAMELAISE